MENTADNSARHNEMPASEPKRDIKKVEKLADIAYNDRFYEDYRPVTQKTIAFTRNLKRLAWVSWEPFLSFYFFMA